MCLYLDSIRLCTVRSIVFDTTPCSTEERTFPTPLSEVNEDGKDKEGATAKTAEVESIQEAHNSMLKKVEKSKSSKKRKKLSITLKESTALKEKKKADPEMKAVSKKKMTTKVSKSRKRSVLRQTASQKKAGRKTSKPNKTIQTPPEASDASDETSDDDTLPMYWTDNDKQVPSEDDTVKMLSDDDTVLMTADDTITTAVSSEVQYPAEQAERTPTQASPPPTEETARGASLKEPPKKKTRLAQTTIIPPTRSHLGNVNVEIPISTSSSEITRLLDAVRASLADGFEINVVFTENTQKHADGNDVNDQNGENDNDGQVVYTSDQYQVQSSP